MVFPLLFANEILLNVTETFNIRFFINTVIFDFNVSPTNHFRQLIFPFKIVLSTYKYHNNNYIFAIPDLRCQGFIFVKQTRLSAKSHETSLIKFIFCWTNPLSRCKHVILHDCMGFLPNAGQPQKANKNIAGRCSVPSSLQFTVHLYRIYTV